VPHSKLGAHPRAAPIRATRNALRNHVESPCGSWQGAQIRQASGGLPRYVSHMAQPSPLFRCRSVCSPLHCPPLYFRVKKRRSFQRRTTTYGSNHLRSLRFEHKRFQPLACGLTRKAHELLWHVARTKNPISSTTERSGLRRALGLNWL
jgi:hypothetical protein